MLVVFLISKTDETRLKVLILPTAEILSGKNVQAWVSMVLYFKKKKIKIKIKISKY